MKKALILMFSLVIATALIGCGKKAPLSGDQKMFAGKWIADDGTFVVIYLDGGGDMKTSNTSVIGGRTTIGGDSLTIGIGPIKSTLKITEKPKEIGGRWVMVLNGNKYTKQ